MIVRDRCFPKALNVFQGFQMFALRGDYQVYTCERPLVSLALLTLPAWFSQCVLSCTWLCCYMSRYCYAWHIVRYCGCPISTLAWTSAICLQAVLFNVRMLLSFQQPTLQETPNLNDYSAAPVVCWFVSSEHMKCRLLKWLLDHPMNRSALRQTETVGRILRRPSRPKFKEREGERAARTRPPGPWARGPGSSSTCSSHTPPTE